MGTLRDGAGGVAEDESIFAALYPELRRFANVVRPPEVEADDLVQDALAKTLSAHALSELDDPGAYLRTVLVRLAANHRRSLGRRRRAFARLTQLESLEQSYPSDLAELLRLPVRDRALLYMVSVERRDYRDAADVLACSEQAARARASRALRQLRNDLHDEQEERRDA